MDAYGTVESFLNRIAKEYSQSRDASTDAQGDDVLLCLQEVKITEEKLSKESCCMDEPAFESFWACSKKKKGYSGVATFTRTPTWRARGVRIDDLACTVDGEGRFVAVDLGACVLVNVYVPNAGLGRRSGSNVGDGGVVDGEDKNPRVEYKMVFMKELLRYCKQLIDEDKREVIIVGDFNSCFSKHDVHWSIGIDKAFLQCELDALKEFTCNGLFTDVFKMMHPDSNTSYTCFDERTNARERNVGVRIDFVLVTKDLVSKVRTCEIVSSALIPPKWSDHCALYVDIDISEPEDGERVAPRREWTALRRRLLNTSQKSIVSMFAKRMPSGDLELARKRQHNNS